VSLSVAARDLCTSLQRRRSGFAERGKRPRNGGGAWARDGCASRLYVYLSVLGAVALVRSVCCVCACVQCCGAGGAGSLLRLATAQCEADQRATGERDAARGEGKERAMASV
jgi:hypothetical protein